MKGGDVNPEYARRLVWSAADGRFVPEPPDCELDARSDELLAVLGDEPEVFWTLVFMHEHERRERGEMQWRELRRERATAERQRFQRDALERLIRDRRPSKWGDYRTPLRLRALAKGLRRALRRATELTA